MASEYPDIPHNMRRLYRRFERWRSSHARRVPIPESLWTAAGELARAHGINPTAKALHLEYGKLKQRAEVVMPAVKRRKAKALAEQSPPESPERVLSELERLGALRLAGVLSHAEFERAKRLLLGTREAA